VNEKEANENVTDSVGSKKQHLMLKSPQMKYNVVEDLSKLRITLPFIEVVKIPQKRKNILRLLDNPYGRMEDVFISPKQSQDTSTIKLIGKIPHLIFQLKIMMLHFIII
jgi:hypothetical protein